MKDYMLSCDWGTTSFRLRLVAVAGQRVVGEILSQQGISETFNLWKESGQKVPRVTFFMSRLKVQLDLLAGKTGMDIHGLPVVLSGMASSSIGMQEIPYAALPFALDGSSLNVKLFERQPDFANDIMLVSGVRSDHDVMRGEETQLIGLNALIDLPEKGNAIFIFPGTHCKHLQVSGDQLVDFKTFMTGEVFNLMSNHSILKDSLEPYETGVYPEEAWSAFSEGIEASASGHILNALFTVRTNQLFGLLDKKPNAMYLSGILIGAEMRYLTVEKGRQLVLCSGNNLFELYKASAGMLGLMDRTTIVPSEIIDKAATAGHICILENQKLTLNKNE